MPAEKNHREFTRVKVAIHVELRMGGNVVIQGELENVSFNGLLLRCETTLPEQTPCLVFLHLDGGQGGPTIEAQGLVARTEPHKLAVQFTELIGNESTHHLRNLVMYNSGTQADRVEEEFESHVGLNAKS
jgi:hypothetical protein